MKSKLIIFGILICGSLFGQRQDTIYQTLATNSQIAGPKLWGPVTNIGQSFHQAHLKITALNGSCKYGLPPTNPAGANLGYGVDMEFVGSYTPGLTITANYPFDLSFLPGKQYSNLVFGNNTLQVLDNYSVGAFPFIYIIVDHIDVTNCNYTISYSGTINPITPIDPTPTTDYFATISSATTTTAVAATTSVNRFILYSMFLNNKTAGQTVTVQCHSNDATIRQDKLVFNNMGDGQTVLLPVQQINSQSSTINYLACRSIDGIEIVTANGTDIFVKLGFRYE